MCNWKLSSGFAGFDDLQTDWCWASIDGVSGPAGEQHTTDSHSHSTWAWGRRERKLRLEAAPIVRYGYEGRATVCVSSACWLPLAHALGPCLRTI